MLLLMTMLVYMYGVVPTAAQSPSIDTQKQFDGYPLSGIYILLEGVHHKVPIFMDPDRGPTIPFADCKRSSALLTDVCVQGSELQRIPAMIRPLSVQALPFNMRGVYKKPADEMLHIAVFTKKSVAIEAGTFYFTPGPITNLSNVIKKYGPPKEKEIWKIKGVNIDGVVNWWGDIGLAALVDDTITHLFIRECEGKKN